MSTNIILVELKTPEKNPSIDANSLFWLNKGKGKQEILNKALNAIEQELRDTPDQHKTEKRLQELVRARRTLWVNFKTEWEKMMKELLGSDNTEVRQDVRDHWKIVEKNTAYMVIKYVKEVRELPEIDATLSPLTESHSSIKMKMD